MRANKAKNKFDSSVRFKLGIWLLMLNYPIGYGGMFIAFILYEITNYKFWLIIGGGCYGLSWIMLGAGFLLAGKEGMHRIHNFWRKTVKMKFKNSLYNSKVQSK